MVLTAEQIAAIYQRAIGGVLKACTRRTFVPKPMEGKPWRWRKADVLRHVEGARGFSMRRVG
jgi:hypothetical protein